MAKGGWVYSTANRYRGGMYVGVSADIIRRVYQHREGTGSAHVRDFGKTRVVYVEYHADIGADNPAWLDLRDQWFTGGIDEKSPAPFQARGDGGL